MKLIQLLLSTSMLLLSSLTFAGAFQIAPVTIVVDGDSGRAGGNLLAARFSDNFEERIGCAVGNGDSGHYAYCEASLGAGNDALCFTFDTTMIDTIASINTLSYVYFEWKFDGIANVCTHVTVATRSIHIPQKFKP